MIDCVLATDMSFHFKEFNAIKARVVQSDYDIQTNEQDRLQILKFAFHLSDISNSVK
jgi:hypothetical protein